MQGTVLFFRSLPLAIAFNWYFEQAKFIDRIPMYGYQKRLKVQNIITCSGNWLNKSWIKLVTI